jgi:hypothetical protein
MEHKRVVEITRAQCGAGAPARVVQGRAGRPPSINHELISIY